MKPCQRCSGAMFPRLVEPDENVCYACGRSDAQPAEPKVVNPLTGREMGIEVLPVYRLQHEVTA